MIRVERLAAQDQIAAAVRELGRPARAREIKDSALSSWIRPCACAKGHHNGSSVHLEDGWDITLFSGAIGTANYLARLHKAGVVDRETIERRVYWRWVGPIDDMSEFELALADA